MKDEALEALRALQPELHRQFGVVQAGVFGSVARGDSGPESDVDVLVRIDPDYGLGLWGYAGLVRYLKIVLRRRLGRNVDVADIEGLNKYMRPNIERDVVYAF